MLEGVYVAWTARAWRALASAFEWKACDAGLRLGMGHVCIMPRTSLTGSRSVAPEAAASVRTCPELGSPRPSATKLQTRSNCRSA